MVFFIFAAFMTVSTGAIAQVDPTNASLLNRGSSREFSTGLESGRYESAGGVPVENLPRPNGSKPSPRKEAAPSEPSAEAPTAVIRPKIPVRGADRSPSSRDPSASTEVAPVEPTEEPDEAEKEPDPALRSRFEYGPSLGFAHLSSKSNSDYRVSSLAVPFVEVEGRFALNPSWVIGASYLRTSSGSVPGVGGSGPATATYGRLEGDLSYRRSFGHVGKSRFIEYGLGAFASDLEVAGGGSSRSSLKSTGFGFRIAVTVPVGESSTWNWGGAYYPRIAHSEVSGSPGPGSGDVDDSTKVRIFVGGDWLEGKWIWEVAGSLEQNQFSGASDSPQPSGETVSNVSATQSGLFLKFGYRWGRGSR